MPIDVAQLTSRLVAIPSQSPPDGELGVVEAIEAWLTRNTDAVLHRVETLPGRPSLAAVLAGGAGTARGGPTTRSRA